MSGSSGRGTRVGNTISIFMVLVMTLHLYAPFASAAGMVSCNSTDCDEYDSNEDLTPHQEDWIEGVYEFKLINTEKIELELFWELREFNRESLGLGGVDLSVDGLDANDGLPADLIRDILDTPYGETTVRKQLIFAIGVSIKASVEEGFGQAEPSTSYVDSFTNSVGATVLCSTDPLTDAFDEGALTNNVFEPPICLKSTMEINVNQSSFNLPPNSNLDLERAYQGLLVMGAEVTTMFDLVSLPGHKSSYSFHPPPYATVKSVDSNGTRAAQSGSSPYFAGEWELDHRNAGVTEDNLKLPIEVEMMHRTRDDTTTVSIPTAEKALDLQIQLDLRDENAVTLDFVVALHYLDEATMEDWGISVMSVAERATLNQVTADGIRLSYHNGLINLSNISSQFPVATIAEGVSSAVAGTEPIEMNNLSWVSDSVSAGIAGPAGGLNFTHRDTNGCNDYLYTLPTNPLNYCVRGPNAMSYANPIYLQSTSQPFKMKLLDIMKGVNQADNDSLVTELINVLDVEDFRKIMNSGLEIETSLNESFLTDIIPSDLPPAELTLEIILPSWIQTKEKSDRIILKDSLHSDGNLNLSFSGITRYDWRQTIKDDDGKVVCESTQPTCITSDLNLDAMSLEFNEWDRSASFEFGVDASISMHRIGIPEDRIPSSGDHSVSLAAIPSDLLRLGLELSSDLNEPFNHEISLDFLCSGLNENTSLKICSESINFVLTTQGLSNFVERTGVVLTDFIHQMLAYYLESEDSNFKTIDMDAFEIQFNLDGHDTSTNFLISDKKEITLSVKIPRVTFQLSVDGDLGEMLSGDFETTEFSLTTNALRQTLLWPMTSLLQSLSGVLTNGVFSVLSPSGITSPSADDSLEPYSFPITMNSFLDEEFKIAFNGPVTLQLPKGIKLVDLTSSSGFIEEKEVDGRQQITYNVPYGEFEDTISFRLQASWYFFFNLIWQYIVIIVILSYLGVRRFKKKRARKRQRRIRSRVRNADKVSINPDEFADLSGFHSKGFHGEMESLKDYSEEAPPPLPPVSAFGISAIQQVDMGDDLFD